MRPIKMFQFLTGSRFHFYQMRWAMPFTRIYTFQFLTGSRFHFYTKQEDERGLAELGFNSLQEVGFISTRGMVWVGIRPVSFNSLQEVGFISTLASGGAMYSRSRSVSIPYRK